MKRSVFTIGILVVLLGGAFWWLTNDNDRDGPGSADLLFHCAAGLRKPMSEIARQYQEEFGVKVNLQFGGSGAWQANSNWQVGIFICLQTRAISTQREKRA